MSLHIVIGFDGQGSSANAHPVYTGKSRAEAQGAMDQSNAVRFEVFSNVTGVRKNNPHYKSPAAESPAAETQTEEGHPQSRQRRR